MFTPVDYGVCTLAELMERVAPQSVVMAGDGTISLPRREPTAEERARTVQFAMQVRVYVYCLLCVYFQVRFFNEMSPKP